MLVFGFVYESFFSRRVRKARTPYVVFFAKCAKSTDPHVVFYAKCAKSTDPIPSAVFFVHHVQNLGPAIYIIFVVKSEKCAFVIKSKKHALPYNVLL